MNRATVEADGKNMQRHALQLELPKSVVEYAAGRAESTVFQAKAVLRRDNYLVLLRRTHRPGDQNSGRWEFPGGPFDVDEQQALSRHLNAGSWPGVQFVIQEATYRNIDRELGVSRPDVAITVIGQPFERKPCAPTFCALALTTSQRFALDDRTHEDHTIIPIERFMHLDSPLRRQSDRMLAEKGITPENFVYYNEFRLFLQQYFR